MSIFKRIKRMRLDKEHLLDILKNDDDWELRKSAADKLRVFEETDVVDALLYALQNDSNEDVRVKIGRAHV